jgi:hypothetical protein
VSIQAEKWPGSGINHLRLSNPEVIEKIELHLYTTSGSVWHITDRNLPLSLPHILAHVNTECPNDRYPELKICISELI